MNAFLPPQLLKKLREDDPMRLAAVEALMLIGDAAVPALIDALGDPDPMVRGVAAEALGEIGSAVCIPYLLALLGDPQEEVRRASAWALGQFGKQPLVAVRVVPGLFDALQHADPLVRTAAILALGPIKHPDIPNALLWALGDPDADVREAAADALAKTGKETLDVLIGALAHEHPGVRGAVARALAHIADEAATPGLIERLWDEYPDVRRAAAEALGQIEDPDATGALVERLWDPDPGVRRMAAWALGEIEDTEALPALLGSLDDPDPDVKEAAAESLGKLEDVGAIPSLLAMLGSASESVRRAACRALGRIGEKHPVASPDLLDGLLAALRDPDPVTRRIAARAVGDVGAKLDGDSAGLGITRALLPSLLDPDAEVRKSTAAALGTLGDDGAVEGLVALLRAR